MFILIIGCLPSNVSTCQCTSEDWDNMMYHQPTCLELIICDPTNSYGFYGDLWGPKRSNAESYVPRKLREVRVQKPCVGKAI